MKRPSNDHSTSSTGSDATSAAPVAASPAPEADYGGPAPFAERVAQALAAGEPLPWPNGAPSIEDIPRLSMPELYRLHETFNYIIGTPLERVEHRAYVDEVAAYFSLRIGRIQETIARHLWAAIDGEPEDLAVLAGIARALPYEERQEVAASLAARRFDVRHWCDKWDDTPWPDAPEAASKPKGRKGARRV